MENSSMLEIVIIDDEVANIELLSEVIQDAGHKIRPAIDPNLALISIQARQPDLILCDINMPSMSGYELYEKLQQHETTKNIPFVFVSGSAVTKDRPIGSAQYKHIMKPIDFDQLFIMINSFFEN